MKHALARALLAAVLSLWLARSVLAGHDQGWAAYERGDYATALAEWLPVDEQGDASAQVSLGVMYANGYSVPQDDAEAVKRYRLAAEQGDADAQFNLGAMYGKGEGVPQDYVQAHMWWILAAAKGNEDAKRGRDIIAKLMTPADISKAQVLAREWLEEHGE